LAVVTGASGGLGFEVALALAKGCADVIVAARNEARGRAAAARIRPLAPHSLVRFEKLDLADLASVAAFAARLTAAARPVDLLVNNAGVMAPATRSLTADGFEMQFGVNYLSHFALTARLLPLLRQSHGARVVQVSSLAHRLGRIHFDYLNGGRRYRPLRAYAESKLASLVFAQELQRRSDAQTWGLLSCAAHPGYARTDLFAKGPGSWSAVSLLDRSLGRPLSQSAVDGAQPLLFAALSPDVRPGGFYGPGGLLELAGPTTPAQVSRRASDRAVAGRLWELSEELTGIRWPSA
jgi:NAD(P)-dependent dehydrogenase (short-subunit alcohol dehydrogenase family)